MFAGIYYCRARLVIQRRPGVIFIRRCTGSDQTPREPSRCPREPLALERNSSPPHSCAPKFFLRDRSSVLPSPLLLPLIFVLLQRLFSSLESNSTPRYLPPRGHIYIYTRYNVKSYSLSDSPREERAVFLPKVFPESVDKREEDAAGFGSRFVEMLNIYVGVRSAVRIR